MSVIPLDVETWAEQQFGNCALGDRRRTRRAVRLAAQVAANPSGSTPQQTEHWADCKAAYRLFDNEHVTFEALAQPHWRQTRARTEGIWLLISDTTHVDFGIHRQVTGLAPTGDGGGRGFLLHSSLMVRADSCDIAGLAGQVIRYRQAACEKGSAQRLKREDRESIIWGQVVDQIGPPPEAARFIHVFDRGGDNFEAYCHCLQNQTSWVVRVAQQHRLIRTPEGKKQPLCDYVAAQPVVGTYELEVRANHDQPARRTLVEVRFGAVVVPRSHHASRWVKDSGIREIAMRVVEVREVKAPKDAKPLQWMLLTAEAVECFEDCWKIISYYEQRPLVEEFHKALKTGCRVEDRLYETADRLEAVTAMLSVTAVRLLQLKTLAREQPDLPARQVVPPAWIRMLHIVRRRKSSTHWTVREFYRELAKLGGFLGRRRDGQPGWITLWRGFEKLHLLVRGAEALNTKCG